MTTMVLDKLLSDGLCEQRRSSGTDQYDEVWEGIYVLALLADDQHQDLQTQLGAIFTITVAWTGLGQVRTGVNISDREDDWRSNFRIPDIAIFLAGTSAKNLGTHWLGGPDFAVEIASAGDLIERKLRFYADAGVRELLVIDRDPWRLRLYRSESGELRSTDDAVLASKIIPLTFQLASGGPRPRIEITHNDGVQRWLI